MTDAAVSEVEEFGPDYFQDPLGFFARVRAEGPAVPVRLPDGGQYWVITRYADVRAALADPRLHKDYVRKLAGPDWQPDPMTMFLNVHMLATDPPDHTRLRKLVTRAFTARRIAGLRPRIEAITTSLLDAMAERLRAGTAEVDLIEAFAFPLPVTVICELLGVPARDQEDFEAWSHAILSSVGTQAEGLAAGTAMYRWKAL